MVEVVCAARRSTAAADGLTPYNRRRGSSIVEVTRFEIPAFTMEFRSRLAIGDLLDVVNGDSI